MNRTPNTPANGGQILTDERIESIFHAIDGKALIVGENQLNWNKVVRLAFARAIEADLRASLATPAIPTVDRNAVHSAVTPMFLLNAAMCIESPHEVATSRKREVLASLHRVAAELQDQRMAARKSEPAAQPAAQVAMNEAARDVLAERQRQVEQEGWTSAHDDKYHHCELARAAATYALCSHPDQLMLCGARAWPWKLDWWKRTTYRRDLIKSAALLLAEIERIDRATPATVKTAEKN